MTDIKSMNLTEMAAYFKELGEPVFRGKQVFLAPPGRTSFDEMTNLSKPLREKLADSCILYAPQVARKQVSSLDGTIKYLWRLRDGNCIETVLMRYHHGNTVCISSQVGCRMGCAFCASTIAGKVRDLTPSEMLDQVLFTQMDSGAPCQQHRAHGHWGAAGQSATRAALSGAGQQPGRAEHRYAAHLAVHLRPD